MHLMKQSNSTPQAQERVPIGELVRRSGIAASTLRFYEEAGLLLSLRSDSGRRHYARSDLRRLAFIRAAQTVGLSLDEIRAALAELPESRTPTAADWERLSKSWRPLLDRRIAELVQLRDTLSSCIGCGCLSLSKCKLYNPGDRAGQKGAGARYLLGDRAQDVLADLSPLDSSPSSGRAARPGAAPARAKKR
jgi:MerR family redox-sensitive transcriptional activator SoxR